MDLPTYTSIWRIEKRLYKLYDFRLPMPVPVGQIAVFAAITVPYVIILTVLGLPFSHTLFWLYVLPPGVLTWLATRPVLESKRLPELVISQVRYLGEPPTWCRMSPLAEKDEIAVVGRVWRRTAEEQPAEAPAPAPARRPAPVPARPIPVPARPTPVPARTAPVTAPARAAAPRRAAATQAAAQAPARAAVPARPVARPGQPGRPMPARAAVPSRAALPSRAPGQPRVPVAGQQVPAQATGLPPARLSRPVAFGQPAMDPPATPAEPAARPVPVAEPGSPPPPAQARPGGPVSTPGHAAPARPPRWPGTADQPSLAVPPPSVIPAARPAPSERSERSEPPRMPRPGAPARPAAQPTPATAEAAALPLIGLPEIGLPEIAHDERHAPPLRAAAPEPAPSERPAALAPGEAGQPGWAPSRPVQAQPENGRARDAAPAPTATPHVPAAALPQTPAEVSPHAPAEAAAHAPSEAPAEAPAEAVPPPPAEAAAHIPAEAAHAPAEAAVHAPAEAAAQAAHAPAEAAAHAPSEALAEAPAEAVPQAPAEAAAHAPSEALAEALAEAVPQAPAEPAGDAPAAKPAALAEDPVPPAEDPAPPSSPVVVVRGGTGTRPAAVERALGAPGQQGSGISWREHVRVVPGGHGPGRPDMERRDRARVLLPIRGPRLIVVLGCTVGAGQTVTALMLADVLASLRTEPVAALDLNPGQTSLAELAGAAPAATARGLLAGQQAAGSPNNGSRDPGQLALITHDFVADGRPDLTDAEYARLIRILGSRYPLTLTDPGATAVARVLAAADQLVLVAPASADAAQAVTMTMEWLDGHGYGDLVSNAIAVINGVSKRSMTHVEQAELVVRGRCRATVRVPWDDHLGAARDEQQGAPGTGDASRFGQLRPPVQHAYTALAGVLVSALAVEPARPHGAAT